jgi:hypothetical protein
VPAGSCDVRAWSKALGLGSPELGLGVDRIAPDARRSPAQSDLHVLKQVVRGWHQQLQKSGRLQTIATQLARAALFGDAAHGSGQPSSYAGKSDPGAVGAAPATRSGHAYFEEPGSGSDVENPADPPLEQDRDDACRAAHLASLQHSAEVLRETHRRMPKARAVSSLRYFLVRGAAGVVVVAACFQLMTSAVTVAEPIERPTSSSSTEQTPVAVWSLSAPRVPTQGLLYTVTGATPANLTPVPAGMTPDAVRQVEDRRDLVRQVQVALLAEGHDPGPLDGLEGPRTRTAVRAFQVANRMHPTGAIEPELVAMLLPGR